MKLTPHDVAKALRDFIESTGRDWDWDDFTSLRIRDPQLDSIRRRAAQIDLPAGAEEIAALRELLAEAEALSSPD